MPLATESDLIEKLGIEQAVALKVSACLDDAEDEVRRLIGDTLYEELEALTDTEGDQWGDRLKVIRAECRFAYAEALPEIGTRLSEKGGIPTSIGLTGGERQNILDPAGARMQKLMRHHKSLGRKAIRHLILASDVTWAL